MWAERSAGPLWRGVGEALCPAASIVAGGQRVALSSGAAAPPLVSAASSGSLCPFGTIGPLGRRSPPEPLPGVRGQRPRGENQSK